MIYFAVVHEIPSTNYSVTLDTIAQGHWPESVRIPNVGESIVLDSNYYDILRIDFEIETEPAHLPGIEGELVGVTITVEPSSKEEHGKPKQVLPVRTPDGY
jgi:hypothetical protein